MVTVPNSTQSDIIVCTAFLSDDVGQMVARHDTDGPTIDVAVAPTDSGQRVELSLSPAEARDLAGQLTEIADVAQRAAWTPAVLTEVRERFLPGHTDQQIIERLDRLARAHRGMAPGHHGTLGWRAGRLLTAELGGEAVARAVAAIDAAADHLAAVATAAAPLTELRTSLDELAAFYRAESERP
ncbi:hypothetical protein [Jiangella gansuensis]|uniref:hypothetical protein n=1 Tax=Jiangella gansuensis TaxID=281473 RepID=UPI000479815F|nr:hypothetical protein [Jiangella gansuensis]